MSRSWLWAVVPLFAGLLLSLVFYLGWLPNPILYARFDLAALSQICGLGAGLIVFMGLGLNKFNQRKIVEAAHIAETQAAEDRRRFIQRLDHELKNPLTAIQAGLANLPELEGDSSLDSVKAQIARLSRLVADLRKLADLETRPIDSEPVPLSDVLEITVDLARESDLGKDRTITLVLPQAPWPLPDVSGDYDLLLLAMHNLLNNALKFTQPHDTIEVRAYEDGAYVVIEVADTGPGIPSHELPHIWDELYRGDQARGIAGSGLGLALVRAIVDRHAGQVGIRSRTGQGSVFNIRLPSLSSPSYQA